MAEPLLSDALALLADGRLWEIERLIELLEVDERAFRAILPTLEGYGLQHHPQRKIGFASPLDLLSKEFIGQHLSTRASELFNPIKLMLSTGSTNDEAMADCRSHLDTAGRVYLAEQQAAGRGRLGRKWYSPFASNIYLSAVVSLPISLAIQGLSLAVGVAVVDALFQCGLSGAKLKWPNDILWEGKKLGGILVELPDQQRSVIGIGVNVVMPAGAEKHIDQSWTDLSRALSHKPSRNHLVASLLNALAEVINDFQQQGLSDNLIKRWQTLDSLYGTQVVVTAGNEQFEGIAQGIDNQGALKVQTPKTLRLLSSAEVSLRPVNRSGR